MTYRINTPDVSAEVFDQEVLAINLKSGHYHSLRGAAVPAWVLLTAGCSVAEVVAALASVPGADAIRTPVELEALAGDLLQHGLLVPEPGRSVAPGIREAAVPPGWAYVAPEVEHYSDMQELLLLDPIHEVDATGWPNQPVAPAETPRP